jgi:hypothetical protein
MGYYSFVALARYPVAMVDPLVMLGEGVNVFTALVEDLDEFLGDLKGEGVEVKQVNVLDGLDPIPATSLLLPGEDPPPDLRLLLAK